MKKIILFFMLSISYSLFAQRAISMNFDLYQNAANNVIAIEGNFPLIYSGSVGGLSYYFELEQPTVQFNQNYMKMIALLRINTSSTGYLELELQTSIYVNYQISTDEITAYLNDFPAYINSSLPHIPQWVRDKIIEHYQSLHLEMYPAKILDYAENYIPNFLDVEVSNILFSVISKPGKLQIGITFDVIGIAPFYQCLTYNHSKVKITSNVRVDIIRLTVGNIAGQVYYDYNGVTQIQKDGNAIFNYYDQNNLAIYQGGRYVRVLLHSDIRGTFLRRYNAWYMPDNSQWYGPLATQITLD